MNASKSDIIYDVIIVGGGLSGLVSAYKMLQKESTLMVLILEAKDYLGGRLSSVPIKVSLDKTVIYDIGAQWISSDQFYLQQLINELEVDIEEQYTKGTKIGETEQGSLVFYNDSHPKFGNLYENLDLISFIAKLDHLSSTIQLNRPSSIKKSLHLNKITMQNFINNNLSTTYAKKVMDTIIKSTCGIETNHITALYYLAFSNSTLGVSTQYLCENGGARQYWIKNGTQQICEKLLSQINGYYIEKGQRIIQIKWKEKVMSIKTEKSTFKCLCLIMAIPPKQISEIEFIPSLPANRKDIFINTQSGHVTKFIITFKKNFWRDKGFSGEVISLRGPILLVHDASIDNFAVLTGYAITNNKSPQSSEKQIKSHLIQIWGTDAAHPLDYKEKLWNDSSLCPFYCLGPNAIHNFLELSLPTGRIFWAGSETSTDWNGYMNGAIQAGNRAAVQVLYELRPQSISWKDVTDLQHPKHPREKFNRVTKYLGLRNIGYAAVTFATYVVYKCYRSIK